MTDEIFARLYEAANDQQAAVLDELRERAGFVWTHRAADHTWTNPTGATCERCGMSQADAEAAGEAEQ